MGKAEDPEAVTAVSEDTKKATPNGRARAPSFRKSSRMNSHEFETVRPDQRVLTPDEKLFLLNVERGDVAFIRKMVTALGKKKSIFDINCVDPLGRSGLCIAIENENLDMVQYLLEAGIEIRDALLVAIREDYVDGVDCLLKFEEENHKPGTPYSWEAVDQVTANFTTDITPLILAAQRNNYEILKMLLDRGATIPMPHDVKCSCDECVEDSANDSLRFSLSRINAYKALASPSLICLSSKDPIITAFELSNELKRLSVMEAQFREEYCKLRKQVQELATGLVDQARTSYELEILLNHNPDGEPWIPGEVQTLSRLVIAIDSNQKEFVTHSSVQQLLAAIWYDGLPGFRRLHIIRQSITIAKVACMFPIYSMIYIIARGSSIGKLAKKPFVKFINNSASYMFFLFLLALASQRVEHMVISIIVFVFPENEWTLWLAGVKAYWEKHERGSLPTMTELLLIVWIQGLIWKEVCSVYKEGLLAYLSCLWNLADIASYGAFMNWIGLRALSFILVQKEVWDGVPDDEIWIPRSEWQPFDPYLLAEGMFGAGMISSFLKLIHIFSINPHLGPMQVSLGKMIIDIAKFLVLYILVLFSFGCGLNQLLWYYADLEKQQCYSLPGGLPDFDNFGDSCVMWRRFANLWETSQSLFWASFGLVELGDFELKGIKEFTRFWGLLMFGSYSVCNIIVLLNMLIAMMSNSYTIISSRSDMEWKFARSKLWISYFGGGDTVVPPFNLIPTPRNLGNLFCKKKEGKKDLAKEKKKADSRYYGVVRCLVRRYITEQQRKDQDFNITEDDINEVRQDIRSFRFELINILKMNNMKTPNVKSNDVIGRKSKDLERMIQKGFNISKIEGVMENVFAAAASGGAIGGNKSKDLFKRLAKGALAKKDGKDWNSKVRQGSVESNPIGSSKTSLRRHQQSLRRSMLARGNSEDDVNHCLKQLDSEQLVNYNPKLADYTPATRVAYAKFKSTLEQIREPDAEEEAKSPAKVEIKNEKAEDKKQKSSVKAKKVEDKAEEKATEDKKEMKKSSSKKKRVEEAAKKTEEALAQKEKDKLDADTLKPELSPVREMPEAKTPIKEPVKPAEKPAEVTKTLEKPKESPKKVEIEVTKPEESPKKPESSTIKLDSSPKKPDSPQKSKEETKSKEEETKPKEEEIVEEKEPEEPATFDSKGKSITTGRAITGWI